MGQWGERGREVRGRRGEAEDMEEAIRAQPRCGDVQGVREVADK